MEKANLLIKRFEDIVLSVNGIYPHMVKTKDLSAVKRTAKILAVLRGITEIILLAVRFASAVKFKSGFNQDGPVKTVKR